MNLERSEEQEMVRQAARGLRAAAHRAAAPTAIDRDEKIPAEVLDGLAELGLFGVNLPDELGGAEAGVVAYSPGDAGGRAGLRVHRGHDGRHQHGRRGDRRSSAPTSSGSTTSPASATASLRAGSFALSEPEAGSDPGAMRATATRDGDDWILDGAKQWITSGDFAGVSSSSGRARAIAGTKGISAFLVRVRRAEGLTVGRHEEKMGLRGSSDDGRCTSRSCRVPGNALLGDLHGGFKIAMMALDGGRIGIASQAIGIAEAALDAGIAYAKDRKTFGKPIADYQAIQWMIADSRTELDAAIRPTCSTSRATSTAPTWSSTS